MYPQDALQVIGFSSYARVLLTHRSGRTRARLRAGHQSAARADAGRPLPDKHPDGEPIVLVVTDGEPTAHLTRNGTPWFAWPPEKRDDRVDSRRGGPDDPARRRDQRLPLDDDPRLTDFVHELARRNGGRVFDLRRRCAGEYVVSDYLAPALRAPGVAGRLRLPPGRLIFITQTLLPDRKHARMSSSVA